jgi:hypothetical protein
MKNQVFFSIITFTMLFCKISFAQSPVTAESIIKRYVDLTGGAVKWESVNSIRFVLESKPANGKFLRNLTIKESPFKYYNESSSHSISNSKLANAFDYTEIYNNGIYIYISGGKIDTVKDAKNLMK